MEAKIDIDRSLSIALNLQIARGLEGLIRDGRLPTGARLPSSRRLAEDLGVSRNTVVLAYDLLLEDGWVEAGVGRGTFVASAPAPDLLQEPLSPRSVPAPFPWHGTVVQSIPPALTSEAPAAGEKVFDFAGAVPSTELYPADLLQKRLRDVFRREGGRALDYGPPAGYRPLRDVLASRARQRGVVATGDDVLITGGTQQGLDLVGRLLLKPGDAVVVESPSYANAMQLWRLHGARVLGAETDGEGILPGPLAAVLAQARPKMVYLMPSFQNPTGCTMTMERRRSVMEVLTRAQVPVVEEDFSTDLRYRGRPLPPLKALDRTGQVVLLGTFSKMLCPGLRVGWLLASPGLRQPLLELKRLCDLATSLPSQMALAELVSRGDLDRHLAVVRREHGRRLEAMLEAIERHLPASVVPTIPDGGLTLWLRLPEGASSPALAEEALSLGVWIAPGTLFSPEKGGQGFVRLSFVGEPPERIDEGMALLGRTLAQHRARPQMAAGGTGLVV